MDKVARIKEILHGDAPVILEVGACDFVDTKKFIKNFPNARIYCFEPNPAMKDVFEKKIGAEERRCRFYGCALGDRNGTALLRFAHFKTEGRNKSWPWAASIVNCAESNQYPDLFFEGTCEVPVMRLDTWLQQNPVEKIDFMWTDVQGSEKGLIEGARETLKITHFVQLEFGETGPYPEDALTQEGTIDLMKTVGFSPLPRYSDLGKARGDIVFENDKWPSSLRRK